MDLMKPLVERKKFSLVFAQYWSVSEHKGLQLVSHLKVNATFLNDGFRSVVATKVRIY